MRSRIAPSATSTSKAEPRRDPRVHYHSLGGRSRSGSRSGARAGAAEQNLSVFFPAAALVLDPRARTFAVRARRLACSWSRNGGPDGAFRRAVRWPLGALDPQRQLWAAVALPAGSRLPEPSRHARRQRGGNGASAGDGERDLGGSRLVAFGLNTSACVRPLSTTWEQRQLGIRLKTTRGPVGVRCVEAGRSIAVEPAEREVFLDAVRRAPAQVRTLLAELDGAVDVVGGSQACLSADACEDVEGDRAKVGIASHRHAGRDPPRARTCALRPGT